MVFPCLKLKKIFLKDLTSINELGVREALNLAIAGEFSLFIMDDFFMNNGVEWMDSSLAIISISEGMNDLLLKIKEASEMRLSGMPVFIITDIFDAKFYALLATLGINGLMTINESYGMFIQILNACLINERIFCPYIMEEIGGVFPTLLSPAEKHLIFDILQGKRIIDIAKEKERNIKTISTHKLRIMKRLSINNNSELSALGGILSNVSLHV